MDYSVCIIIGVIFAILATVLAWIFIVPEKKAKTLNKFWYKIHRILNLKDLLIEKILKTLYIFSTAFTIFGGFMLLFAVKQGVFRDKWIGYIGILIIVFGPIAVRLVQEILMSYFILISSVQNIQNKVCDGESREEYEFNKKSDYVKPEYIFCEKCGVRYDKNRDVHNCDDSNKYY